MIGRGTVTYMTMKNKSNQKAGDCPAMKVRELADLLAKADASVFETGRMSFKHKQIETAETEEASVGETLEMEVA